MILLSCQYPLGCYLLLEESFSVFIMHHIRFSPGFAGRNMPVWVQWRNYWPCRPRNASGLRV